MMDYVGLPLVINYQTKTIIIGPSVFGLIQNDVCCFCLRNPMAIQVKIIKIGIGQLEERLLAMCWLIGWKGF